MTIREEKLYITAVTSARRKRMLEYIDKRDTPIHRRAVATKFSVSQTVVNNIAATLSSVGAIVYTRDGYLSRVANRPQVVHIPPRKYTIKCIVDDVSAYIITMYKRGYKFGTYSNVNEALQYAPHNAVCSKLYPNNQFSLFPKSCMHIYEVGDAIEMVASEIPKLTKRRYAIADTSAV